MTQMGLTKRQADCLAFIKSFVAERGYSPSFREVGAACGLKNMSHIHRVIHGLRKRGHLDLLPSQARSIVVTERAA